MTKISPHPSVEEKVDPRALSANEVASVGNHLHQRAFVTGFQSDAMKPAYHNVLPTAAAEGRATAGELMALFDWETPAQVKVYADRSDRHCLAGEAMHRFRPAPEAGQN
jgi:hypothetical protein